LRGAFLFFRLQLPETPDGKNPLEAEPSRGMIPLLFTGKAYNMMANLMSTYRGLKCRTCGNPIPVSTTIATLADRADAEGPHSFGVRCKGCLTENIYTVTDLRNFEGAPRQPARLRHRIVAA
jgi:hypothetical protein